jgi:hypothetical protein
VSRCFREVYERPAAIKFPIKLKRDSIQHVMSNRLTYEEKTFAQAEYGLVDSVRSTTVRLVFWCAAIVLGFLQAWASRMDMVNDTISYLDMGDYMFAGQWSKAVNGVWNPLYAYLLGLTLHGFRPSIYWQYPAVHLLLFVIFLFAAACFDFFLREMIRLRRDQEKDGGLTIPEWLSLTTGYVLFLWSSLMLIRVSETNPDMLVAAFFYLACAFLVQVTRSNKEKFAYLGFGLALGLGYLTKSVMFPISLLCFCILLFTDVKRRRGIGWSLLSLSLFLTISIPFITALSIAKGRLTFSESGVYNYLVHVNRVPFSHWQGSGELHAVLLHPTRQIVDRPATYMFTDPVGGSYPVWFDPSYWYEGARPHFRLSQMAATTLANFKGLASIVSQSLDGVLVSGLFLLFCASGRGRAVFSDIGQFWFLIVPSVAALCLYAQVHIEMRYIAPFLVVVILSLWFSIYMPPSLESQRFLGGMGLLLVLMFINSVAFSVIRNNARSVAGSIIKWHGQLNRNEEIVNGLRAMGLRTGDRITSLEYSNCAVRLASCEGVATWARLGRFKIVAEVNYWPEDLTTLANNFWGFDSLSQERVVRALAETGARMVLTCQEPRGEGAGAWQKVGNTAYYGRWLVSETDRNDEQPGGLPGPLVVSAVNPRYFADPAGNIVYLAGDHTWANLVDRGTIQPPAAFNYDAYMTFMTKHGFNWMRAWTKEMANSSEVEDNFEPDPYKWVRAGPGTANDGALKYDFTRLDPNYFSRMRSRIIRAGQNGIYVSVQLFNGADWSTSNSTDGNPFESMNNVNGVNCGGTCPYTTGPPALAWNYEIAYAHKVIDTVHDLSNVLFEITNETDIPTSLRWQLELAKEVRTYESRTYETRHPIGITWGDNGKDQVLESVSGFEYYNPGNNVVTPASETIAKVIINDTDHSYGWGQMKNGGALGVNRWAWENFTNGVGGIAFMDPYLVSFRGRNACSGAAISPVDGDPGVCTGLDRTWDPVRLAIADTIIYAKKIDLKHMIPLESLSSSGYCLASPGSQYLVFSTSNSFSLNAAKGTYSFEWFDPLTHKIVQAGEVIVAKGSHNFRVPFSGDAVLWMHK